MRTRSKEKVSDANVFIESYVRETKGPISCNNVIATKSKVGLVVVKLLSKSIF